MGENWNKFVLLMWRNYILQKRKPFQTIIELLAPIILSVFLVIIRAFEDPKAYKQFDFPEYCITNYGKVCPNQTDLTNKMKTIAYSPNNNSFINSVMTYTSQISGLLPLPFPDSKGIYEHFEGIASATSLCAIEFPQFLNNKDDITDKVEVVIRFPAEIRSHVKKLRIITWSTNVLFPQFQLPGPREMQLPYGGLPSYQYEGFILVQFSIGYGIILTKKFGTGSLNWENLFEQGIPCILLKRFPFGKFISDYLLLALENLIPMIIVLSFVYSTINIVKTLCVEKEKQIKEITKIMGLPTWIHWTTWFTKCCISLTVSVVIIIILLKISWNPKSHYSVLTHSDGSVLFIFLIFYVISTVAFSFAVSAIIFSANTAAAICGCLWFVTQFPFVLLNRNYASLTLFEKLFVSLLHNSAMSFGFKVILMYEGMGEGSHWDNIWEPCTQDDNISLGLIMIMMLVDTILYILIALYFDQVFPGPYGIPKPWHFPIAFLLPSQEKNTKYELEQSVENTDLFEDEPKHLRKGIEVKNLRKVFHKKEVVKNLSLNMYEGQITCLLGHNGAGKTTTISMITGMITPTSGTVLVDNHDIRTDLIGVRKSLGLCPQHNILFDDLTVKEHLYLYSKLKGMPDDEIQDEINKYLKMFNLVPKANSKSKTLSGGMKRKLNVGIALCGNSKVVLLDEPTAGVDTSARRDFWSVLKEEKQTRTILLSTHYMDEADILGDRIAIMANGQLKCCGSSFFLKKKFGTGYKLILVKKTDFKPQKIQKLLEKYIPGISVYSVIASEMTYMLPESELPKFHKIFRKLEKKSEKYGIESFGISLTTLEEVFMKVGAYHPEPEAEQSIDEKENEHNKRKLSSEEYIHQLTSAKMENQQLLTGFQLIKNQYYAMFMKRLLVIWRSWILLFLQIFIPSFFMILAVLIIKKGLIDSLTKLTIKLTDYKQPVTLFQQDTDMIYIDTYKKIIRNSHSYLIKDSNILINIQKLTETITPTVRRHYMVAAVFKKIEYDSKRINVIVAWYNNDALHTAPLSVSLIISSVYKAMFGENFDIIFANHPMPYSVHSQFRVLYKTQKNSGFEIARNISFGMAITTSFLLIFYIRERVCKSKHLQFISGAKVLIFWTTALICDYLSFSLTIIPLFIVLAVAQIDGFKSTDDFERLYFILVVFAYAMIPMAYAFSYAFDISATGFTRMSFFTVSTGSAAFVLMQIMKMEELNLKTLSDTLNFIFLFSPHYYLATAIRDTFVTYRTHQVCVTSAEQCVKILNITYDKCWKFIKNASNIVHCEDKEPQYYKWHEPGIGQSTFIALCSGTIFMIGILLIEFRFHEKIKMLFIKQTKRPVVAVKDEDSDVTDEKEMIHKTALEELQQINILTLRDVTKYYGKNLVVNGICLGVKHHECFGLLGVNGAGKTTIFKIITGDINLSYGDAWVQNYSIRTEMHHAQKLMGYCPQFDALLDDLTAKETLIMYCLLRGIPYKNCSAIVNELSTNFDFKQHLNKQIRHLSGGNKRKVSAAVSLIGNPLIIYLDEPSAGLDPATQRFLWSALGRVRDKGTSLVLTSHSMEECEALCTRLAILVNGNFKCLGSVQHLKNKYTDGFIIVIKLKKIENMETKYVENFMESVFPKSEMRSKQEELLTFYIPNENLKWSRMFKILEAVKDPLNIEDYSIGQPSLEQVFLQFAKER